MNLRIVCPVCLAIATLVVLNVSECNVLRSEFIAKQLMIRNNQNNRDSGATAVTVADAICSWCREYNNMTCIRQYCTRDVKVVVLSVK